jgi:hypothetical protein
VVGEALDGRLVGLGLLHEPEHPPEGRLRSDPVGLDPQDAPLEDRRGEDGLAGLLLDRHRFPGDGGLIHRAMAVGHPTVHRDPFPGFDEDDLARADRVGRHLDLPTVLLHARRLRGKPQERSDGLARPLGREPLQEVGEAHEEDDHGGGRVLADGERAENAQRHQRVRGDGPIPERAEDGAEDREPAHQNRREREPRREALRHGLHEADPLAQNSHEGNQGDDRHEHTAQEGPHGRPARSRERPVHPDRHAEPLDRGADPRRVDLRRVVRHEHLVRPDGGAHPCDGWQAAESALDLRRLVRAVELGDNEGQGRVVAHPARLPRRRALAAWPRPAGRSYRAHRAMRAPISSSIPSASSSIWTTRLSAIP